jgi:6-phospho-beta-glucosidase
VKVAVLGGGGFRTPLVAAALTDVPVDELVLHDVDADRLARIVLVIEGWDRERDRGLPIRTTTNLVEAVEGAGAVFAAVRVGGLAARVIDETVPLELGVLGQETVGPGGVMFALRTIPEMLRIANVVLERAPNAWFVNFTNPAGLVTEAIRQVLGGRTIGICDSPTALWSHAASVLGGPASSLRPSYLGLNHLGWLSGLSEAGEDLLPTLLRDERLDQVHEAWLAGIDDVRRRGLIPSEYLVYFRSTAAVIDTFRRDGTRASVVAAQQRDFYDADIRTPAESLAAWRAAKDARHGTYMAEARGIGSKSPRRSQVSGGSERNSGDSESNGGETGYGEVAAAFLRAMTRDTDERLILGVRNGGSVPWLDEDATVEIPCVADASGPRPDPIADLPEDERALMLRVRDAERATLEAAASSSARLVVEAIARHPVVPSRAVAERIADGYLARHRWMRERYR